MQSARSKAKEMEIRQANWKFDILNLAIQLFSKLGLEDGLCLPQIMLN